jgi:tyrosine-protein phosphatase YwqE
MVTVIVYLLGTTHADMIRIFCTKKHGIREMISQPHFVISQYHNMARTFKKKSGYFFLANIALKLSF